MTNKPTYEELENRVRELELNAVKLKKAEEKIRKLSQFQESIIENSNIWLNFLDEKANVVIWNRAAEKISGYSRKEVIGSNEVFLWSYPDEEYRNEITAKTTSIIEGEEIKDFETNITCKDGKKKIISWYSRNVLDDRKNIIGSIALGIDISRRKQAEEAQRENEKFYRQLMDSTSDGYFNHNLVTDEVFYGQRCEEMLGYAPGEIKHHLSSWQSLLHPDDVPEIEMKVADLVEGKIEHFVQEYRLRNKTESWQWLLSRAKIVEWDENGNATRLVGTHQDITKRKQAEEKIQTTLKEKEILLQELEKEINDRKKAEEVLLKYEHIISAASEHMSFLNQDYVYQAVNKSYLEAHQKSLQEIIGYSVPDLLGVDVFESFVKEKLDRCLAGEEINYKDWFKFQKLGLRYMEVSYYPFSNADGEITGIVVSSHDITDSKRAEDQLKMSLKEKETLLHEIHHRVKNNMNVVSSLLKLQSNNIEDDHLKDILKESQNRIFAMSAVHETLHGAENISNISLKVYLSKITSSIFQTYSTDLDKVKLNSNVEETPISIQQASPLGLVINELISNSLKYAFPDEREGEINVSMKKLANQLELTVMDDGIGISKNLDWKNSNTLGLKLVRTLVENQLDGSIDMESKNGTKFTIKFNIET